MNVPPEIARAVVVSDSGDAILVRWTGMPPLVGMLANSRLVHGTISRRFRQATKAGAHREADRCLRYAAIHRAEAFAFAAGLRQRLAEIYSLPVGQGFVEKTLRITHQECSRWTKDGRLKSSGSQNIGRSEQTRVKRPTYAAGMIERLVEAPEAIERWRQADRRIPHASEPATHVKSSGAT